MAQEIISDVKRRMDKSYEAIKAELATIRTGKAAPSLLDHVRVDAYGTLTPLSQIGSISAPDVRMLVVQPWDKTLLGEVVKAIHAMVAPQGTQLLVDANTVYSLKDTQDFLSGIGDVPLVWVEEPFVENIKEGRQLRKWMNENGFKNTYYADGERQPNHEVCMTLARENNLDVYLPDINGYGFSAWLELMPKLRSIHMLASPHAWGDRLKTHYIAHLAAGLGNVVTIEGVTCLSDDIDYGSYPIREGKLHVSEDPGFGMSLL